jgi:hypothetical protein
MPGRDVFGSNFPGALNIVGADAAVGLHILINLLQNKKIYYSQQSNDDLNLKR